MKTNKTKLLQDIEAMKAKLASMEEELNKSEEFKHFPIYGDKYYFYTSSGTIHYNDAASDDLKVNTYKTKEEAYKAYKKAVALEKIKRRLLELQGDWEPNWKDMDEGKIYIGFYHWTGAFETHVCYHRQSFQDLPYMKNAQIAGAIIKEMEDELKLIFDIQQIYFDKIEERNR